MRRSTGLLLLAGALAAGAAPPARAAERELERGPAPTETGEIETAIEEEHIERERREPTFKRLSQAIQQLPPFLADTQIDLKLRNFYFRRDETFDQISEAWTLGGSVRYQSGWLADALAVELEGFTSQPLVAPDSRPGTLLLQPVQDSISVLGIANGKIRFKGLEFTGYRQYLDLPYLNRQDNRMIPNTFEAATLRRTEGELRFNAGYVWRFKAREDDDFVTISKRLGVDQNRGLAYVGAYWKPEEEAQVGVIAAVIPDILTNVYAEGGFNQEVWNGVGLRLDGQFSYQQSIGDSLLDTFHTWNFGLRAAASWRSAVLRVGYSQTDDDAGIQNFLGSSPSYVNMMQRNFNRAGEQAVLANLSYDFERLGVGGLSAVLNFVNAWNGRVAVVGNREDRREVDLNVDYRPGGRLEGFWIRLRASALIEDDFNRTGTDVRVILRYDLPVL